MQTLVNAVRSTGANNVIMLGGLKWSKDLTGWLSHEPADSDHNLAASWHSYNFNACNTRSCWTAQIAPVIAKVPVIAGEIGEKRLRRHLRRPAHQLAELHLNQLSGLGLGHRAPGTP